MLYVDVSSRVGMIFRFNCSKYVQKRSVFRGVASAKAKKSSEMK